MNAPKEYRIRSIVDMLAVPADRRDALLADVGAWLALREDVQLKVPADRLSIEDMLVWSDDGTVGATLELDVVDSVPLLESPTVAPDECWSYDGESFCYGSLSELIDNHRGDLEVGQDVHFGTKLSYGASRFFNADEILENARDSACDIGGEWAEDYLDDVTTEDKAALQAALDAWASKFQISFYGVENIRDYTITAEDLA